MMENYPLDVGTEFMAGIIQVNILSRRGGERCRQSPTNKRSCPVLSCPGKSVLSAVSLRGLALRRDGVGQ